MRIGGIIRFFTVCFACFSILLYNAADIFSAEKTPIKEAEKESVVIEEEEKEEAVSIPEKQEEKPVEKEEEKPTVEKKQEKAPVEETATEEEEPVKKVSHSLWSAVIYGLLITGAMVLFLEWVLK